MGQSQKEILSFDDLSRASVVNPATEFTTKFSNVQKKFKDKYGRDLFITGDDKSPLHIKLHGGNARDTRSKDLSLEERNFLVDIGTQEGLQVADYTDPRNNPNKKKEPHLHFQYPDEHNPPKAGVTTLSFDDLSQAQVEKPRLTPNYLKGSKPGTIKVKYGEDENGKPIYREEESADPQKVSNLQAELLQGSHVKPQKPSLPRKAASTNQSTTTNQPVKPISDYEQHLANEFERYKAEGSYEANRIGLELQERGWEFGSTRDENNREWPYIKPPQPGARRLTKYESSQPSAGTSAYVNRLESDKKAKARKAQIHHQPETKQLAVDDYIREGATPEQAEKLYQMGGDQRGLLTRMLEGLATGVTSTSGDITAGAGKLIEEGKQLGRRAINAVTPDKPAGKPTISPDNSIGGRIQRAGEKAATSSREFHEDFGQDVTSKVGHGIGETLPYLASGGGAGFGVTSALSSYGSGSSLDQAILTGIMNVAGMKGGHQLGETLALRAKNPFTRLAGRAIGTGVSLETVRAGTGGGIPDTPEAVAKELAMVFGFSLIGGLSRRGSKEKLREIADNPETHPEVSTAINGILKEGGTSSPRINLLDANPPDPRVLSRRGEKLTRKVEPPIENESTAGYRLPDEDVETFYHRIMKQTAPERRVSFEQFKRDYEAAQAESYGPEPGQYKLNPKQKEKLGAKTDLPTEELIERGFPAGRTEGTFEYRPEGRGSNLTEAEKPKLEPKNFEQGLTPEGSGFSHLSNEELARTDKFYRVTKSSVTSLGKQPDAPIREGEAIIAIDRSGEGRVVNSSGRIDSTLFIQKAKATHSEQQKLDPNDAALKKATPDLVATVEQTSLRELSEKTGLEPQKAEKGRNDIIADGEREFSREAVTIKRAVIEGDLSASRNQPVYLDENSIIDRVTNNYGGPEGLHSEYTAEGLRRVLNLPDDFQLNPLIDSGLVERTGRGYRFSDDIQGGVKRVSDVETNEPIDANALADYKKVLPEPTSNVEQVPFPESGKPKLQSKYPTTSEEYLPGTKTTVPKFEKFNTSEEVRASLHETANKMAESGQVTESVRGVRDWETTEKAAKRLGVTVEDLRKLPKGTAKNAEYLKAVEGMLLESKNRVDQARKTYESNPTDENLASFIKAKAEHDIIYSSFFGLRAEAGRALNILKSTNEALGYESERAKKVKKISEVVEGKNPRKIKKIEFDPSKNTIFTQEKVEAARLRIQKKLRELATGQTNMGAPLDLIRDYVEVAGYYVEAGLRGFKEWSVKMKEDFPYLLDETLNEIWPLVRPTSIREKEARTQTPLERANKGLVRKLGQEEARSTVENLADNNSRIQEARDRINQKVTQGATGRFSELSDLVELGGHYLEGGVESFRTWSNYMRHEVPSLSANDLRDVWTLIKPEAERRARVEKSDRQRTIETLVRNLGQEEARGVIEKLSTIDDSSPDAIFQFNKVLRDSAKFSPFDKLATYHRANLMSGVPGALRDVGSTGLWQLTDNIIFRPTRALVEQVSARVEGREPELYIRETVPAIRGLVEGIGPGFREAINVLKHGYDSDAARRLDLPFQTYQFSGGMKNPFNAVLRFRSALNECQRYMGLNAELHAEAYRIVRSEGLRGERAKNRYNEIISNPSREVMEKVTKYSEDATFTNQADGLLQGFYRLRSVEVPGTGLRPLEFVFPFVKTTYNIMKRGLELTPAGSLKLLSGEVRSDPVKRADTIAKAALGSAFMAFLAANTELTGAVPDNKSDKEAFYASGKMPYSVKINGKWVSYRDWGPPSIPMAIVAAFSNKYRNKTSEDFHYDLEKAAGIAGEEIFLNGTALRTLTRAYDNLTTPWKGGIKQVAAEQMTGYVPFSTMLRNVAESQDEYLRKPDRWYHWIMQGLPGLRPKVPLHKEPIKNRKVGLMAFSPVTVSDASDEVTPKKKKLKPKSHEAF